MSFPLEFFDLSYAFAMRCAEVSGCSTGEALLRYTHLYLAFGLGRGFDPTHPAWQSFLAGLETSLNPLTWIDSTYHQLTDHLPERVPEHSFGCFSYALWSGGRVRLHFYNPAPGTSPLLREELPARLAELGSLLAYLRAAIPEATTMVGGSWLYNIEAYRRLFPPAFLSTAAPEEPEPQFIALWGQFLDHHQQVKPDLARQFREEFARQKTISGLLHCFPYPVLRLECPLGVFYKHFGVGY